MQQEAFRVVDKSGETLATCPDIVRALNRLREVGPGGSVWKGVTLLATRPGWSKIHIPEDQGARPSFGLQVAGWER